jgi:hypothetical protein
VTRATETVIRTVARRFPDCGNGHAICPLCEAAKRYNRRMQMTRPARLALTIAVTILLTLTLVLIPLPSNTRLWKSIYNCGHAPLFGLFSYAVFILLPAGRAGSSGVARYGKAFALSVAVGLLTETVQLLTGGDFELQDLARDAAGAFLFLAFVVSFDRTVLLSAGFGWQRARVWIRTGSVILAAAVWLPAVLLGIDYERRNAAFPVLFDVRQGWGKSFVRPQGARIEQEPQPSKWSSEAGDGLALVSFRGRHYPGIAIEEPYPDWNGFSRFEFTVFSEVSTRLAVRINDSHHNDESGDRYNRSFVITPGRNVISIPLQDVVAAPKGRTMDMAEIRQIVVFAPDPQAPFSLSFSRIELCR